METLYVSMQVAKTPDNLLLSTVGNLVGSIELEDNLVHFTAQNDEAIGEVVMLFVQAGIGVHRISANQPNLEDIFS